MFRRLMIAAILSTAASPALAHVGSHAAGEHASLMAGLAHPLSGADHLLAMLAVGLWAAQLGGRARLAVPASFVALMVAGFAAALAGFNLPMVEPVIAVSVIALGLAVAFSVRVPAAAAAGLVGLFAVFHGSAHGSELAGASALSFGLGFAMSTALIHAAGLVAGQALLTRSVSARIAGGLTAAAGAAIALG